MANYQPIPAVEPLGRPSKISLIGPFDGAKFVRDLNDLPAHLLRQIIQPDLDEVFDRYVTYEHKHLQLRKSSEHRIPGSLNDAGIRTSATFPQYVTAAARFALLGGAIRNEVFIFLKHERIRWNKQCKDFDVEWEAIRVYAMGQSRTQKLGTS